MNDYIILLDMPKMVNTTVLRPSQDKVLTKIKQ